MFIYRYSLNEQTRYSQLLISYLSFFSNLLLNKNCSLQGIRTQIVGVEGELADHLTTAQNRQVKLR